MVNPSYLDERTKMSDLRRTGSMVPILPGRKTRS
jgi:hypothetical protein